MIMSPINNNLLELIRAFKAGDRETAIQLIEALSDRLVAYDADEIFRTVDVDAVLRAYQAGVFKEPPDDLWPPESRKAAQAQGWDIFDADGSVDGRWQLQAIAVPADDSDLGYTKPKLADDRKAAAFVQQRADRGDELARRAIRFLFSVGSRDVVKFGLRLPV